MNRDYVKADRIRQLKAQGLNQTSIAKELGSDQSTISAMCRVHGISWERGAAARDQTGDKNPAFKDGLSKSTINRLTKKVLNDSGRNLQTCERCGYKDFTGIELPRHHKDRNRANNGPNNLEVLCWGCHSQEHMSEQARDTNGKFVSK